MSAQATRLSSLLLLVRDGSSAQIRENAAEKLGQVATQSSESCHSILQQIRPLIVDQDWDIRVAASKCVDVVAHSLRNEDENVADLFAAVSLGSREASCMTLNLQSVDIAKVVQEGAPLLRSGGEEYQYATNLSEDERRIHAVKQRRLLLQRLSGAAGPIWKTREDTLTKQLLPRLNRDHAQEIADDIEASEAEPKVCKHIDMKNEQKQARDMLSISKRKRHPDRDADGGKSKLLKVDDHNETETALTSASLELGE
ncbi:btaf1 RNA polymerase II, B-TFIID transcription factor-associated, 170kDa [Phytophthora boehmeriae]|uniref:Btaf1 RNA polymerase II, B-TFIID transcription factor-associated, 170kDa n=1 Tax=Phytophthora boehmeriae TaxID=109152 RepID=A0A8T1WVM6_9STRA|nr:btaf1 RNA polymerase II, B-TFIID transcription factor-associated, 170kDa [Phytophthora boehmeriae]